MADELAEAARLYEQYQKANKMAMDTEKYGAIGPADTSLLGAVRDSIHRFKNPGMEAGLESTVFTEPISNWLENSGGEQDWGALAPVVKKVGQTAASFVPKTRGDAMLATALAAVPAMKHFKDYPGAIGIFQPTMSHPPLYQRIRKIGGQAEAKLGKGDFGGVKAPGPAARKIAVRDRLSTSQKLKRDVKETLGQTATDVANQSSPYQGLTWSKTRAAITNSIPGLANDISSWARRYFAGEE